MTQTIAGHEFSFLFFSGRGVCIWQPAIRDGGKKSHRDTEHHIG